VGSSTRHRHVHAVQSTAIVNEVDVQGVLLRMDPVGNYIVKLKWWVLSPSAINLVPRVNTTSTLRPGGKLAMFDETNFAK